MLKVYDSNRLDILVTPKDENYAFEEAIKRRDYSEIDQKAYRKMYDIYKNTSHLEYPNWVVVENDYDKESPDVYTNRLVKTIEAHESFGKLVSHAKKYKQNLLRETPELLDI